MNSEWWHRFRDLSSTDDIELKRKSLIFYTVSYAGSLVLFFFSFQHMTDDSSFLFLFLLVIASLVLVNSLLSHQKKYFVFCCHLACIFIVFLLLGLIYSGGEKNTALYWIYPFPAVFFILLSHRSGLLINLLMFSGVVYLLNNQHLLMASYEEVAIIRFEFALALTIFISFTAEFVRSSTHRELSALTIEKHKLAITDQLTKLPNRHFLETVYFKNIENDAQDYLPMSVVMADIDYFKNVNDTYGHDIGDKVLCHIANILQQNIRQSDVVVRVGGEEFLLLFAKTPLDVGVAVARKLGQILAHKPFVDGDITIAVTISLGVALASDKQSVKLAISAADKLLYVAKTNGRNTVEF